MSLVRFQNCAWYANHSKREVSTANQATKGPRLQKARQQENSGEQALGEHRARYNVDAFVNRSLQTLSAQRFLLPSS